MTAPQSIDTDALRKRVSDDDLNNGYRWATPRDLLHNMTGEEIKDLVDDLRDARDELDRLRAAEAASKAQEESFKRALQDAERRITNVHANRQIAEQERDEARAEIARITDAGAPATQAPDGKDARWNYDPSRPTMVRAMLRNVAAEPGPADFIAPPPPAAADRGVDTHFVPERRVSNQRLASMIHELSKQPNEPRYLPALCDLRDCRAALATAPKAEDVRREAIEEAAKIADAWEDDATQKHLTVGDAIRALADRPAR